MINFSSDGWYGVISDGINFENMGIVVQAVADLLHEQGVDHPLLTVGYDTRFLSREYAWHIQKVLAGNGIKVLFHKFPITASVLSYSIKKYNCNLGIMVTGGGRPARYSGLTFRNSLGLPVSERWMERLFQFLYRKYPRWTDNNRKFLEIVDLTEEYAKLLDQYIDFDLIRSKKPTIIYDAYYGSVGNFMFSFLNKRGVNCVGIRTKSNPGFNGNIPQPIDRNMNVLSRMVTKRHETIGFFFNADGSRLGVVGWDGTTLNYCRFSSMIYEEWIGKQGITDIVLTGHTTPRMVENLVKANGGEYRKLLPNVNEMEEFCHKNEWIRWEDFSMAFGRVLPDFDAVFQSLILLQGLCRRDLDLKGWMSSMDDIVNVGHMLEKHITVNDKLWNNKKKWIFDSSAPPFVFNNINFIEEDSYVKLYLSDGSWIVLKYENFEDTLRIVVESENCEKTASIINDIVDWIKSDIKFGI